MSNVIDFQEAKARRESHDELREIAADESYVPNVSSTITLTTDDLVFTTDDLVCTVEATEDTIILRTDRNDGDSQS